MQAYIDPPKRPPFWLRLAIRLAERQVGKPLLAARILAWYPKTAVGAAVMESLVADQEGVVTARLLKLLRLQVSLAASCPFCIDMNAVELTRLGISAGEIAALQGLRPLQEINSLSRAEKLALRYARALTATPIAVETELLQEVLGAFSERELVVIVGTIAQVNFWTRLIQGIGVPPAGFSAICSLLRLNDYTTLHQTKNSTAATRR